MPQPAIKPLNSLTLSQPLAQASLFSNPNHTIFSRQEADDSFSRVLSPVLLHALVMMFPSRKGNAISFSVQPAPIPT